MDGNCQMDWFVFRYNKRVYSRRFGTGEDTAGRRGAYIGPAWYGAAYNKTAR